MSKSNYESSSDDEIMYERAIAIFNDTGDSCKMISVKTNLHRTTIQNIYYHKSMGITALRKICDAYLVSPAFILGYSDNVGNYHINNIKTFSKSIGKKSIANSETVTIQIHRGENVSDRVLDLICNIEDCDDYVTRCEKAQDRLGKYYSNLRNMFNHTK